jgi:hypothetical protein
LVGQASGLPATAWFFWVPSPKECQATLFRFDWVDLARASNAFRESGLKDVEVIYEPCDETAHADEIPLMSCAAAYQGTR